jgi:hypothetical protein
MGTLLFAVQSAIADRLRDRLVDARVSYEPPRAEGDLSTDQGIEDAIWFAVGNDDGDDGTVSYEIPVFHGPYSAVNPLWLDEVASFTVVVQCVRRDGTQAEADKRLAEMLRDVLAVLATKPEIPEMETAELQSLWVVPQSAVFRRGPLPASSGHGSQVRVDVQARSRLKLT